MEMEIATLLFTALRVMKLEEVTIWKRKGSLG